MTTGWHTQEPADASGIPLTKGTKELLRAYYRGARLESPMGGYLEPLRVRYESDGSGTALFECAASSLRFVLHIPKATRLERRKVKDAQEAGRDPECPRHAGEYLRRIGPYLVCPLCGVRYGRPV